MPANAIAVTGNLTAVGSTVTGSMTLLPTPTTPQVTSTISFPARDARANGVTLSIGPGGTLWVIYAGPAGTRVDVLFDVTGYFMR